MHAQGSRLLVVGALACASVACQTTLEEPPPIEPGGEDTASTPEQPDVRDMQSSSASGTGGSAGAGSTPAHVPPVAGSGGSQAPTSDPDPSLPVAGASATEDEPEPEPASLLSWARVLDDSSLAYDVAVNDAGHVLIASFARDGLADENNSWFPKSLVTELDAQGELVRQTDIDNAWVHDIAIDASDAVVMAGVAPGNSLLPDGQASGSVHTEAFVAKLRADGELAWTRRLGDDPDPFGVDQEITAVTVDGDDNVIIVGCFAGTLDLGGSVLTSAGARDLFVAKLKPDGELIWSKRFGGPDTDYVGQVAIDSAGDILIAGYYTGELDLGGGPLPLGDWKMFIAKLSGAGAHRFSRSDDVLGSSIVGVGDNGTFTLLQSTAYAEPSDTLELLRVDSDGEVIASKELAGDFASQGAAFRDGAYAFAGSTKLPGEERPSVGIFPPSRPGIARYDADFEVTWQAHFGEGVGHTATAVALDAEGGAVIIGDIRSSIAIDGLALTVTAAPSVFVARFAPPR